MAWITFWMQSGPKSQSAQADLPWGENYFADAAVCA